MELARIIHEYRREAAEIEAWRGFSQVRATQAGLRSVEETEREKPRQAMRSAAVAGIHELSGLGLGRVVVRLTGSGFVVSMRFLGSRFVQGFLEPGHQHVIPPCFINLSARVGREHLDIARRQRRRDDRWGEFRACDRFLRRKTPDNPRIGIGPSGFVGFQRMLQIQKDVPLRLVPYAALWQAERLFNFLAPMPVIVARRQELQHFLTLFGIKRHGSSPNTEKGSQLRSRLVKILNVAPGYAWVLSRLRPCWIAFLSILN
jgi:hypothetical protein